MPLLEYEKEIFLNCFHDDGLLIMSQGLGLERILINLIKVYCDPGNLVFVLNNNNVEEDYICDHLKADGVKEVPKVITNEFTAPNRQKIYTEGGVLFVTSRILVVDFLTENIPANLITGIIVCKAHKILDSCQEAFILRLYRQKNKTGFIKAFSDRPSGFTTGFAHVENVMKNLFLKKLFLWPRFHANVASCLDKHKIEVVELHIQMTSTMVACQTALLDLINACISDLKRFTSAIDFDEITVENAIGKSFDIMIRHQLNPIWNQLSSKAKQIVSDLKTLRMICQDLTQYDCVTFFSVVNSICTSEKTFGENSGWLFLDSADSLIVNSKMRVYKTSKSSKKKEDSKLKGVASENRENESIPDLEIPPKWTGLSEILAEIQNENAELDPDFGRGKILIVAEDDRTCNQLREFLSRGGKNTLASLYNKYLASKGKYMEVTSPKKKKQKITKTKSTKEATSVELTEMEPEDIASRLNTEEEINEEENFRCSSQDAYYGILSQPAVIIHPIHGGSDSLGLQRTLWEINPHYVILYDSCMKFVRELEVYHATRPHVPLRVYFLIYSNSVEEQQYLTTLRKEKEAFEFLIKEKALMVIPEERDGKLENDPNLHAVSALQAPTSSRKGGMEVKAENHKIIVDMREFRSELPSLLHRRGIDIEPITLEVGDYILTPDICVERKSISDLIGSLSNGRLFNQCVAMSRHYKRPVLLIEFDTNKYFSLNKYQLDNDVSIRDNTSRLALLTLHFPNLRILWCQNPFATAELFHELKVGREQPSASAAIAVSETTDYIDKYNPKPQDFLLKLPGVNLKNYRLIMNKVTNIYELSRLTEEELTEILGNASNAQQLLGFLRSKADGLHQVSHSSAPSKPEKKRPFKRKL
ncbi:DNA repair endonuclease XPF [Octopus bimaculoides]|uniref:DNA repair endonuclease XPF n=1 Tax=Octopus bimaculoides TaxID=37653 RepID=A0A0L8HK36_OCTBM|nr:DNA repair endonuclease XPF [Octopus bimaculoides]|eukprot:XP_014771689.1 PREDICTED: DNA repair endonuclease XPF-like [Octopus bimaculoides]